MEQEGKCKNTKKEEKRTKTHFLLQESLTGDLVRDIYSMFRILFDI